MVAQTERKKIRINIGPGAVSPKFLPYLRSQARHLLLWGGRDSTKSDFVALKLLLDAMQLPYFCCILIREKQNTIADSQIATLKKVAVREGLMPYFKFPEGPSAVLEVRCLLNGNKFIGRGTDDMDRVKSVSDPTCVWYEEANQIKGTDADVVSTTLRTSRPGAVIQEIYTFNPDHEGDYKTFWLWKKFFEATGHPNHFTFGGNLSVDVDGQLIHVPYQVVHSTYHNNPWCPPERAATYEAYGKLDPVTGKAVDEYRYDVWCLGKWATKRTGNEFYHKFNKAAHVRKVPYLPDLAIYTSWDANSLPYSAMLCGQLLQHPDGRLTVRVFKEYTIGPPEPGVVPTAKQFLKDRQANGWASSSVMLTGDRNLKNKKVGEGSGTLFKDIEAELNAGRALHGGSDRWLKHNPNVDRRGDFINNIFRGLYPDLSIELDESLSLTIADLEQVQRGIDGKLKTRVMDTNLGVSYEPIGHLSDCLDYLIVTLLPSRWEAFEKGYKR